MQAFPSLADSSEFRAQPGMDPPSHTRDKWRNRRKPVAGRSFLQSWTRSSGSTNTILNEDTNRPLATIVESSRGPGEPANKMATYLHVGDAVGRQKSKRRVNPTAISANFENGPDSTNHAKGQHLTLTWTAGWLTAREAHSEAPTSLAVKRQREITLQPEGNAMA
jgi:hypothetical protein